MCFDLDSHGVGSEKLQCSIIALDYCCSVLGIVHTSHFIRISYFIRNENVFFSSKE